MSMVLSTDYIKFIFIQLCVVMGVCVGGWVGGVMGESVIVIYRRAGRKLKTVLTLVVGVTATDIKQEIRPEHSEANSQ